MDMWVERGYEVRASECGNGFLVGAGYARFQDRPDVAHGGLTFQSPIAGSRAAAQARCAEIRARVFAHA